MNGTTRELIEAADLVELHRHADRLAGAHDWDGLVELQQGCRAAVERGKQLWAVAAHAGYLLALLAPGPVAARAVLDTDGRYTAGPVAEAAASTHRWHELAAHLPAGPARELVAHERVVRGEDLRAEDVGSTVWDLPLVLAEWEPRYATATFRADGVDEGEVALPARHEIALDTPGRPVDDPDATAALLELTRTWTRDSNGRAQAVAVAGDAAAAIAALGPRRARAAPVGSADALALMAWCAASGGAHGRRRGAAAGRVDAWWATSALAGFDEPPGAEELGDALTELRWWVWDAYEPAGGWRCQLAVEDPDAGLAWALAAFDDA